jgi:hypothetical protein
MTGERPQRAAHGKVPHGPIGRDRHRVRADGWREVLGFAVGEWRPVEAATRGARRCSRGVPPPWPNLGEGTNLRKIVLAQAEPRGAP